MNHAVAVPMFFRVDVHSHLTSAAGHFQDADISQFHKSIFFEFVVHPFLDFLGIHYICHGKSSSTKYRR